MVQHHPWPALVHGAFSNSSIVLHGLKREKNQKKFRAVAERRGLGPLVPFKRVCGTCAGLGWSTWPGSRVGGWTCCGCDATASKAECDRRMGQALPAAGAAAQRRQMHSQALESYRSRDMVTTVDVRRRV